MRTDEEVESGLVAAGMEEKRWAGEAHEAWMRRGGGEISLSISGYERNRLFLSLKGKQFEDISDVSGLDALGDGRAFALWDYDRDGWQDIAVVNVNAPLLSLYRNEIGNRGGTRSAIALRFVGGNDASLVSSDYGPRDGYGAAVTVYVGGHAPILREHRCGEGLAAQNSSTLLIGIGDRDSVDSLAVRWPHGSVQRTGRIAAGTLLTAYENPAHSSSGEAFVATPYTTARSRPKPTVVASSEPILAALGDDKAFGDSDGPALKMFTSTATWCPSCKASLPQLRFLREVFDADGLEMSGVPIDPEDHAAKLEAYVERYQPAYRLRTDWSAEQIAVFSEILLRETGVDVLPSTLVTDAAGHLLLVVAGVPNVSQLRRLLTEGGGQQARAH